MRAQQHEKLRFKELQRTTPMPRRRLYSACNPFGWNLQSTQVSFFMVSLLRLCILENNERQDQPEAPLALAGTVPWDSGDARGLVAAPPETVGYFHVGR